MLFNFKLTFNIIMEYIITMNLRAVNLVTFFQSCCLGQVKYFDNFTAGFKTISLSIHIYVTYMLIYLNLIISTSILT